MQNIHNNFYRLSERWWLNSVVISVAAIYAYVLYHTLVVVVVVVVVVVFIVSMSITDKCHLVQWKIISVDFVLKI